jgi:sec-independent protein translocase protein TatC
MVSVAKLREIRPYVIVGAFVIGAIFTPPDIISQFMLAVPLWVLYEAGIIVAALVSKPESETESDYVPMSEADMDSEFDQIESNQIESSRVEPGQIEPERDLK